MTWDWHWHPHPDVWALVAIMLGGYFYALRALGPVCAPAGEAPASAAQRRNWVLGVAVLLVSAEWPVHDLAEGSLYSVHMIQHMLLTLVAAPLLMAGLPPWLVRAMLPPRAMRVARALTRPLIALVVFNGVLVLTHWPRVVEASVGSEPVHLGLHTLIMASALVMWSPVLSPVIELPRLAYPGQMMYLFLQSLVPTVPASFLTFGSRPLYEVYETMPRVWGISALSDQRTAGLIMKIAGGALLWGFITALFFKWFRIERDEGVDALAYGDVERTLSRMELTK